jgi:hypothetical protein
LFFPDGIAFDGKGFVGTRVTALAFSYLRGIETGNEGLLDLTGASWNPLLTWLRQVEALARGIGLPGCSKQDSLARSHLLV